MEGGSAATTNGNEGSAKKGLDGTGLDLPLNRHGNLKSASSDQSLKEILLQIKSSKTPAVVNYSASWCGVCSQILPSFCQLSNNFPKLSFIYADIDECPETTQHIRYTPTFHFYQDGEKVDEMYGAGEDAYGNGWKGFKNNNGCQRPSDGKDFLVHPLVSFLVQRTTLSSFYRSQIEGRNRSYAFGSKK